MPAHGDEAVGVSAPTYVLSLVDGVLIRWKWAGEFPGS